MAHIEKDLTQNKLTHSLKRLVKLLPKLKEEIVKAASKDLSGAEKIIKMHAGVEKKRNDVYSKLKAAKEQNRTLVQKLEEEQKKRQES